VPHCNVFSLPQFVLSAKMFLWVLRTHDRAKAFNRLIHNYASSCAQNGSAVLLKGIETEQTTASEGRKPSPQRLCCPAQRRCHEASFYLAAQSETRSTEAVCVCWDDRNSRRPPIRKSQKRLQISLGCQEIWRSTNARALRAFEPDAV
jgi:hypothetical protein